MTETTAAKKAKSIKVRIFEICSEELSREVGEKSNALEKERKKERRKWKEKNRQEQTKKT